MKLLLIRHGETRANVDGHVSSWAPGEPLTPNGLLQAERLVDGLRGAAIDRVFASTLVRAQQTALPLAIDRGVPLTVVEGLQEIEAGEHEGGATPEQLLGYLAPLQQWGLGDLTAAHPGGFDGHHFLARFDAAVERIARETGTTGTAAVITHSGCIGVWAAGRADNISPAYAAAHHLGNIDVVDVVGGEPGTPWRVESWGRHGRP